MFTIMPWYHAVVPLLIMVYQGNMRLMFRQTDQVKAMFAAKLVVSEGFTAEAHDAPLARNSGAHGGSQQLGSQLEKIYELGEKGFLSEDECEAAKRALLQPTNAVQEDASDET